MAPDCNSKPHFSSQQYFNYWPTKIFSRWLKAWPFPSVSAKSFLLSIMPLSLPTEVAEKLNYLSPTSLTLLSLLRHISNRISLKHPPLFPVFFMHKIFPARHKRTECIRCSLIWEINSISFAWHVKHVVLSSLLVQDQLCPYGLSGAALRKCIMNSQPLMKIELVPTRGNITDTSECFFLEFRHSDIYQTNICLKVFFFVWASKGNWQTGQSLLSKIMHCHFCHRPNST